MRAQLKEFIQTGSIYSVGTLTERGIRLLYLPIVTAFVAPSAYGVVAVATVAAEFFARLMAPYKSALNRYYYNPEFVERRPRLIFTLFSLLFIKTVLAAGVFVLVAPLLARVLASEQSDGVLVFQLFALIVLFQPVSSFLKTMLRLQQKAVLYVVVSILHVVTSLALVVILLAMLDMGIAAIPLAGAGGLFVSSLIMLPVLMRTAQVRFDLRTCREPLSYGYPLIFSAYSNYALQSADRLILRVFCPLSLVGVYHIAYTVSSAVNFLLVMPTKQALHPIAFKKESDPDTQKRFLRRTATLYYSFALWAGLAVSLFAKEILMVFARDESYWQGWVLIPLIVFAYVQHGLGNFVGLGMVMRKKAFLQSGTLVVTAAVNIGLNFLLIPRVGLMGAAIATVAAYIVWNLQKGYFSWKYYELGFEYGRLLLLTGIWIILLVPGLILSQDFSAGGIAAKLGIIGLFPLIIYGSGFLKSDEKAFLVEIVQRVRYMLARVRG